MREHVFASRQKKKMMTTSIEKHVMKIEFNETYINRTI